MKTRSILSGLLRSSTRLLILSEQFSTSMWHLIQFDWKEVGKEHAPVLKMSNKADVMVGGFDVSAIGPAQTRPIVSTSHQDQPNNSPGHPNVATCNPI